MSYAIKAGDITPVLEATLKYSDGTPVNLAGATVDFLYRGESGASSDVVTKSATIVGEATGEVQVIWVAGETYTPGDYLGEFHVTVDGVERRFPTDTFIYWSITPSLDSEESFTPYDYYYRPLRSLLGDLEDLDVPDYSDDQLQAAIQLVVNMGKIEGYTADGQGITPGLRPGMGADQVKAFSKLIFWAAKSFLGSAVVSGRTEIRAFKSAWGENKELTELVIQELHLLEQGVQCD